MAPPGRPKKPEGARALKFGVTLLPRVAEQLDEIMNEDGEYNRSAAIAKLISEEDARRKRRRRSQQS